MINNVICLSKKPLEDKFYKYWLIFLKPIHGLTDREIDVMTAFLLERFKLSLVIKDLALLDTVLMNEDTKRKIRENCNISSAHFQVIMGKLRKNKAIIDGKINPKLIPNIDDKTNNFQLLVTFPIKNE